MADEIKYPENDPCVAVTGGLLGGFKCYGPFKNVNLAIEWADAREPLLGHVTVMHLLDPDECGIGIGDD